MGEKAIRVAGLGKEYQIGSRERGYTTFREALTRAVTAPFRRLRKLSGVREEGGSFWALKDVSFEVEPGEVVGIIGRNGAGKSTLLKVLSQIVEPTSGEIKLNGRVGSLLEVGTGFHPELTGRENIYLNGALLGMSRREVKRKFDEIVQFSEVDKFLDTPVKRYSSGMYTRLAFSVAAHLEPEILIVDEVLAVGDVQFQEKCLGKMGQVARGGRTVLFVSHNMAAVEGLCNRCVVLGAGRVTFDGDAAAATAHYQRGASAGTGLEFRRPDDPPDSPFHPGLRFGRLIADGVLADGLFRVDSPLRFDVECDVGDVPAAIDIGIGIDTIRGFRVATAHTATADITGPRPMSGRVRYSCCLPNLRLAPGVYDVKLAMNRDGVVIDEVERAIRFEVIKTDYRGNLGRYFRGVVIPDQEWSVSVGAPTLPQPATST